VGSLQLLLVIALIASEHGDHSRWSTSVCRLRADSSRVGGVDDVISVAQIESIRARVTALMPQVRADLEALTRIPSVSLAAFDQAQVDASA